MRNGPLYSSIGVYVYNALHGRPAPMLMVTASAISYPLRCIDQAHRTGSAVLVASSGIVTW